MPSDPATPRTRTRPTLGSPWENGYNESFNGTLRNELLKREIFYAIPSYGLSGLITFGTIVSNGGGAANWLSLTTQNPVRSVYLTSGRSRRLRFGKHPVELPHAPRWQLAAPHRMAGVVIRALAWLGPEEVEDSLDAILPKLSEEDLEELAVARGVMPVWMAEPLSTRLEHG